MTSRQPAAESPRRPGRLAALAAVAQPLILAAACSCASAATEIFPPEDSDLPPRVPVNIVKGLPVFASPSPSPRQTPRPDPGTGRVEVRGFSSTTPAAPLDANAIYRAAALPKPNKSTATDGHNRTLAGFYAVKPYRDPAPRRLRFEMRLEAPGSRPQESMLEMDVPADGKIRLIPGAISLPIIPATRPGEYRMEWTVTDVASGDWDTASAFFSKANVEKVADISSSSLPVPPPVRRPPSQDFAVTPPKKIGKPGKEDFVTAPAAPRKEKSHDGFRMERGGEKDRKSTPQSTPSRKK